MGTAHRSVSFMNCCARVAEIVTATPPPVGQGLAFHLEEGDDTTTLIAAAVFNSQSEPELLERVRCIFMYRLKLDETTPRNYYAGIARALWIARCQGTIRLTIGSSGRD